MTSFCFLENVFVLYVRVGLKLGLRLRLLRAKVRVGGNTFKCVFGQTSCDARSNPEISD